MPMVLIKTHYYSLFKKTDGKERKLTIHSARGQIITRRSTRLNIIILLNIYINDLFYILEQTHLCNYTYDTTFYACNECLCELLLHLEHDSLLAGQYLWS